MWIAEIVLLLYFFYVAAYALVFSVGAHFYKAPITRGKRQNKYCILIPSYKEDNVIVQVAREALRQEYPSNLYTVVIIADSLRPDTILKLKELPLVVHEVNFDNSTKVKSLNSAMSAMSDDFDYAVILDADNVMHPHFLTRLNDATDQGHAVVQGQRKPKNSETTLSFLDGVSEAINNHIYRQGATALGLSASINGSGIAFPYRLLKNLLSGMNSVGGFDRELELILLQNGHPVFYHKGAIVYDEKTSKADVFKNQRKRWISSQYFYLAKYFNKGMSRLLRGDFTYFNSSVLRNIQLPRLINLGLLTLITVASIALRGYLHYGSLPWIVLFTCNAMAILIAIPRDMYSKRFLESFVALPGIFASMVMLLFKLNGANKKFIHTPHGVNEKDSTHS